MNDICSYHRGRLSIPDAMELPVGDLQILYYIARIGLEDPKTQQAKVAEEIEDVIGGGV